MDTVVSVRSDIRCTEEIKNQITALSEIFDCFSPGSEISELNRVKDMECSDELTGFVKDILSLNDEYGFGVDISAGNLSMLWKQSTENGTLPDEEKISEYMQYAGQKNISVSDNRISLNNGTSIDPGAAAKGYVLDCIFPYVSSLDTDHTIVSTGSSTLLWSRDSSHIFSVAVKSGADSTAGTVTTGPCFVSTSGDYERFTEINGKKYHHIIDMKTGFPADNGLSSVTVFCDSGIMSDFLSTLIFTEGKDNLDKYLDSGRFGVIAIDKQGNIFRSASLIFSESE
ncbi:MAG: FAD:protein FMN transferase [Oscillospiraceae bacterium]